MQTTTHLKQPFTLSPLSSKSQRRLFMSLLISALLTPSLHLLAAPEDRGPKGAQLSVGAGGAYGSATGVEGESISGLMGFSSLISLREEVWPRLSLGLSMSYASGSAEGYEAFSLVGVFVEGRWRFGEGLRGLQVLGALGVGGGGVTGAESGADDASAGGAVWKLGLGYELGPQQVGWSVTPMLSYEHLRQQMDSKTSVGLISFNLELTWELGRGAQEE